MTWDGGDLVINLDRMNAQMDRGIAAAMAFHSTRALTYARTNAPWTDRTSNARNALFSKVEREGVGKYSLVMGHGVPYGVWLETRWAGRYATIKPTLEHTGPEVMRTLGRLFETM